MWHLDLLPMTPDFPTRIPKLAAGLAAGKLGRTAAENIQRLLEGAETELNAMAISELAEADQWAELNDRFYKTLAFGTGGLRGRTIGKVLTKAERAKLAQSLPF